MKFFNICVFIYLAMVVYSCGQAPVAESENTIDDSSAREFYQLKTYTFENQGQMAVTDQYLKDALLPGLHRYGISEVGVFHLADKDHKGEEMTALQTVVLIPMQELTDLLEIEEALSKDSAHIADGADYINASYDAPPYQRIESTILRAFQDMPVMSPTQLEGSRSDRVYELRSYESSTEAIYWNKVDMFNAGGEIKLFDRLGFNAVFYGEVIAGSKMPNLMYMTTFRDMESRNEHWKAFVDAPEWKELIAMDKYKNNVSHADIIILNPTEYSDY